MKSHKFEMSYCVCDEKEYNRILGDWITEFTYVVFDGKEIAVKKYVEGEKE